MPFNPDADLERHRTDPPDAAGEALLRKIRRLPARARNHPSFFLLENFCAWLKSPASLWPTNLEKVGEHAVGAIAHGKNLDCKLSLFFHFLPEPPSSTVRRKVAWHEDQCRNNKMSHLIRASHKFFFKEEELGCCAALAEEWKMIRSLFEVRKFQNLHGFIRRQPAREWHPDFPPNWKWKAEANQFFVIFNTFCYRWNLQGMLNNTPVLSKATIALTPFGTNIFIPAYWSLDSRRDLKWKAIRQLHRIRNPSKQGVKMGLNLRSRRQESQRAMGFMKLARKKGLKGLPADEWVMRKLQWDSRTDRSRLRRLLKLAGS